MVHQLTPSLMPPAVFTSFIGDAGDIVILVLPVLGSMLLFYGIFQVIIESKTSNRKKVQDRLHGKRTKQEKKEHSIVRRGALEDSKSFADVALGKFKFVPKIQTMLNQADLDWSAAAMLLYLSGAALLAVVGLALVKVHVVVAIGCGAVIIILPLFWLSLRRRRRISKITNQLPDVFDMMSQALRAGHSLGGAVQLIYEQMPPPIATEFAQVYHEQNLGMRIEDALKSMADRVDSLDVRFFVTAVVIQRQTGGDLAEVLDNISSVIRERIELAGLVRGLTGEGRLSGWVLFVLPILVFLAVWNFNPNYMRILFEEPLGRLLLIVAGGMQLMGLAMIRWIVNIKV